MATTFAIFKIPVQTNELGEVISQYTKSDYVEVAFVSNWTDWRSPFDVAEFALKDSVPVYPLDNTAQGIYTIGDIKKEIKRQLKGQKKKEPKPKKLLHPGFLAWCSMWPLHDGFDEFEMTRHFTFTNKAACERKYLEYIKEIPEEELWDALKKEIEWRKQKSRKSGKNELKYMNGPDPYLNQRKFEPWLEIEWSPGKPKTETLLNPDEMF
jgi:hypothetical protein